jgi:hypothetical protein
MAKLKIQSDWIRIGENMVRNSQIESVDNYLRWVRTTSGRVHFVPINQKNRVMKELGLLLK